MRHLELHMTTKHAASIARPLCLQTVRKAGCKGLLGLMFRVQHFQRCRRPEGRKPNERWKPPRVCRDSVAGPLACVAQEICLERLDAHLFLRATSIRYRSLQRAALHNLRVYLEV